MVLKFLDTQQGRQPNPRFNGFFPFPHLLCAVAPGQAGFPEVAAGWGSSRNQYKLAFTAAAASFLFRFLRTRADSAEGLWFRFLDSWPGLLASALLPWKVNRTGRNKTTPVRRWAPCLVPVGGIISCLCTQPWLEPAPLKFFAS